MEKVGHLEDEAKRRKERLNALRQGAIKSLNDLHPSEEKESNVSEKESETTSFPKPLFRNYKPKDESLQESVLPKPELIEIANEIRDQLDNGKAKPLIDKEIDLTTLAPQKIDWDLKREADRKLKILERRTQRAIVELIRERIEGTKNTDLAELVSIGARDKIKRDADQQDSQSSEDEDEDNDQNESNNSSQDKFINTKTDISDED